MSASSEHLDAASGLTPQLLDKLKALERLLAGFGRVVVAYSGGVDSALLLKVAHRALGDRARALTARSPSLMSIELEEAVALARRIGVAHRVIETRELDRAGYVENSPARCYHCKTELFDVAAAFSATELGGALVVDGVNLDDLDDHRPGLRAAVEHAVRHPLAEVGLRKSEVRALSLALELPTWNKPQLACLASRIPYGTTVTEQRLSRIEQVETALRGLGFFDVRARLVRENDDMVRIEVGASELGRAILPEIRTALLEAAHAAGFAFITLDLEGFRSGRMNEGVVQIGRRPT
jgi:uncharacterized protein